MAKYASVSSKGMKSFTNYDQRTPTVSKKKNRYKVNFPLQLWLALGLEYLSLTRDSWACSLQGQIGSEHLEFLLQTSKVKLSLAALVIASSFSVSPSGFWMRPYIASEWRFSWLTVTAHINTLINTHFILLNLMQCSCKRLFPLGWQVSSTTRWFGKEKTDWSVMIN